ncbi:Protease PrtS [Colletotrichum aenigma]|uniref:Protease PrtS n=1 Tax=Colletotrichum aenigma TaxID=1215731 RepID=UPI001872729C|nr:Protease PrtS [Colletotrichum aenigma]KAF5507928.1 Protease PrtS [Colletotrichum aenigma]
MSHVCYVVPPYLLRGIADAQCNEDHVRDAARRALELRDQWTARRAERMALLCTPRGARHAHVPMVPQSIVPDFLLKHIADNEDVDEETRAHARRDLEHIQGVQRQYQTQQQQGDQKGLSQDQDPASSSSVSALAAAVPGKEDPKTPKTEKFYRAIYDAKNTDNEQELPGSVVRVEGQKETKDKAVNDAYDNVGEVLKMYREKFDWVSIDNKNMNVISSVHFGKKYENAFWDPERLQMVFGDGGEFLNNFTGTIDVIGHELTHAVTEHTSPLDYQGMSGALNEHVSDVFGIMVKQIVEKETAEDADWLIGEGCIMPGVKGVALRSMKEPGTAYDDPRFGKDPQPNNFKDYVPTFEDNGGVHIYSGIPNKAFYLAAKGFGGFSYEKAGPIWWKTMQSGRIPARCTFIQFADVTVEVAEELYGDEAGKIVRGAWNEVGVTRKGN